MEKNSLIEKYKITQKLIAEQILTEKTAYITKRLEKIIADSSRNAFWRDVKAVSRDPLTESLVVKDANGIRQFHPEAIKEASAQYYESLYKKKFFQYHPYHDKIKEKMEMYKADKSYDDATYNLTPTRQEIVDIINEKKNNKSAPDIRNEMIKRPGKEMVDMIHPLIIESWNKGCTPNIWNQGYITSLHKGKGDIECLSNHRGITTSSSIGTIMDSLIDRRIEFLVKFTYAQGGGKKHTSTFDHLFILRAIIDISITNKKPTFLTFYDVSKAYDNVDNEDMMVTMWEKGLRGTAWRILNSLNSNLSARVKTRFGPSREFDMEIGGNRDRD